MRNVNTGPHRIRKLHQRVAEVCHKHQQIQLHSGQVTIKDDLSRWYYGTYGREGQSHIRSFNRVLF